jgi:hypothetical protein
MANEIPKLQESQPILQAQHVSSEAEGYDAFAKTLGQIANSAEEKTVEILHDQSQTMYINSVANAEQVKTDAEARMLEHPDQVSQIAKDTANQLVTIDKTAFVNKKDRTKLKSYLDGISDNVRLHAIKTNVHQKQLESAFTHFSNFPDQLKAYQQALMTDHDKAEHLHEAMINSLHGLVTIGAITPHQAGASIQTMRDVAGVAQSYHDKILHGDVSAQDLHTMNANPLSGNSSNPDLPIQESTAWKINHYNSDSSFQGVKAAISQRQKPNFETWTSLSEAQRKETIMMIEGTQQADGMINSAQSYTAIKSEVDKLSEKGRVLDYRDSAKKNALDAHLEGLKNDYMGEISKTPTGNRIMRDFVQRDTAIKNTLAYSEAGRQQALSENKNRMTNEAVAYGHGHEIPDELIQPIPKADIAAVQNAFRAGQDPNTLIQTINQYSKENQAYLAQAMTDPGQRVVVQGIALAGADVPYQDKIDFIVANQNVDYTAHTDVEKDRIANRSAKEIEGQPSDKTLMTDIYSQLRDQMQLVTQMYGPDKSGQIIDSMLKTTLNAAKYQAEKSGDRAMTAGFFSSKSKYLDKASSFYKSSFKMRSGSNWVVNDQQLSRKLTNSELDILADYATKEGNDFVQTHLGEARYNMMQGRDSLKMIISSTNVVKAVNVDGVVVFSQPYTDGLLYHARDTLRKHPEISTPHAKVNLKNVSKKLRLADVFDEGE